MAYPASRHSTSVPTGTPTSCRTALLINNNQAPHPLGRVAVMPRQGKCLQWSWLMYNKIYCRRTDTTVQYAVLSASLHTSSLSNYSDGSLHRSSKKLSTLYISIIITILFSVHHDHAGILFIPVSVVVLVSKLFQLIQNSIIIVVIVLLKL